MKKKIVNMARKADWQEDASTLERLLARAYRGYRDWRYALRNNDNPSYSRFYLRSRRMQRNLAGRKINFVTIDQASLWTAEWLQTFPRQYDLIVGVPRSGMLVATIIALKLGKGLTTPDLLKRGEYWHSSRAGEKLKIDELKHVLLVDDSVHAGRAMPKAMEEMKSIGGSFDITPAALIVREETKHHVDLYHKVIEAPRSFEWNILHRKIGSRNEQQILAVDLDGVLCANPPEGADADESWYLEWMERASPYLIPGFEIDAIVTCRLEKYRSLTEEWLERHQVRYRELHMWDVPDKAARGDGFARHKIERLLSIKPDMFWESNWGQAQRIFEETKIPTLCVDEMILLN